MLFWLIMLGVIILLIWIGSILQYVIADFLSYFLLAYFTKFGFSQVSWIGVISQTVSTIVVLWLAYVLWKDFGKSRLRTILKSFQQ